MSILTYALKIKIRRTPKVRRIPRKSCLLLHPRSDNGHLINLLGIAAPGEVVDGGVEALEDGPVGLIAAQALGNLVADVARLDVGEDEGVGVAGHLAPGELQLADGGGDGGVEKLSMATLGSMPKKRAVRADSTATSASFWAAETVTLPSLSTLSS